MKFVPSLLLFSALVLIAGCAKRESTASAAGLPPVEVTIATIRLEEVPVLSEVTGTVRPVRRASIAAKVMGVIEEMPVALGQRVRAGDLLAQITAGEIAARVLQAQSQLNQVDRDLARERGLLDKGASTAEMVRNLEDRRTMTQAVVREAEVMLGYTEVRAPFDGVVARKPANAGDLAAPGMTLLEIEGLDSFQIEASLPDSVAARLAPGTPLTVEVPVAGVRFKGMLAELSSAADPTTRTVQAKISVPADVTVRSGQFARVLAPGEPVLALLAPASAVAVLGQIERVFAAAGGRAVLRLVKTGAARGDRVEILSGLSDGDSVVLNPPPGLRDGQPLVPKKPGPEDAP